MQDEPKKLTRAEELEIILQAFIRGYAEEFPNRAIITITKTNEAGMPYSAFQFSGVDIVLNEAKEQLIRIVPNPADTTPADTEAQP